MQMQTKKIFYGSAVLLCTYVLSSCSSGEYKQSNNNVTIHELSDAEMLNPINYTDASAGYILTNLFQPLIAIDFKTLELVPVLAVSRPQIEKTEDGKGMIITYNIRPEAKWDNGSPITAKDVEFTLKVIKNPKVNCQHQKPYFEFIQDVKLYPEDPKKITMVCKDVYILAESSSGVVVIPEYFYDPKGLMRDFTVSQLSREGEKLVDDKKINEFATYYNSEKVSREKDQIVGSGPYKLSEWITGQRIVLERKKEWWGDKLTNENCYFEAFADKLIYQTVNDQTSALVSLKAGNLDVMYSIKPKDFVDLPKSDKFTQSFNAYTPMFLAYTYIGLNTKSPKLSDKNVRQALAHLVDVEKLIKVTMYDLAERITGPIHPSKKKDYNAEIAPYDYNIDKAKQMLADAGWKDTDGNGILDKVIDGQKTEFTLNFTVNSGNDIRKQSALIFQEDARKAGIEVTVTQQDWTVYLNNQKKHNFEVFFGSWVSAPVPNDFKQIFHTESALNEGSNFVSFGSAASDALIDSIKVELDEEKRAVLNKRFQKILYDETSYIFLYSPLERIAIHKRFTNAEPSVARPGFWEAGFKLAETNTASN